MSFFDQLTIKWLIADWRCRTWHINIKIEFHWVQQSSKKRSEQQNADTAEKSSWTDWKCSWCYEETLTNLTILQNYNVQDSKYINKW